MIQTEHANTTDVLFSEHYGELRRIAERLMRSESMLHTLTATGLVHEGFLRLAPSESLATAWTSRQHFFRVAARAMRRVLIDRARSKTAKKRSRIRADICIENLESPLDNDPGWLLDFDEGLSELDCVDSKAATLVELHLFAGLSIEDAGDAVGLTRHGSYRSWAFAKAWFSARDAFDR